MVFGQNKYKAKITINTKIKLTVNFNVKSKQKNLILISK